MERSGAAYGILVALSLAVPLAAEDTAPEMIAGMTRYLERLTREAKGQDASIAALRRAYGIESKERAELSPPTAGTLGHVLLISRGGQTESLTRQGYAVTIQPLLDDKAKERLYRIGFPLGRHPVGMQAETALGLLDGLFAAANDAPVGIWADAAGAEVALCATALDPRVAWIHVEGDDVPIHQRPLSSDAFGLLRDLGPGGVRNLIPREKFRTVSASGGSPASPRSATDLERRLLDSIPALERERMARFNPGQTRRALAEHLIGILPEEPVPPDPRVSPIAGGEGFRAFDVRLQVRPEFGAAGILLLPEPAPGGRLPLVVVQHGLQGQPQVYFGQTGGRDFETYRNFGETLVRKGFAVYLPQNPYRGDFRHLSRLAHPLGLTLFSLIRAQYEVALRWLEQQPAIDPARIGFYGLSYGGKTALRIPPLDPRFKVVVCAGDFNEWVRKLVDPSLKYSYIYTQEYEVLEWNLAKIASHAEMAMLMAPRPFLVERGHRDGVGEDEWVSYEFAKVRRYYDEHGLQGKAHIVYFNGPHRVDGAEALRWLELYLK